MIKKILMPKVAVYRNVIEDIDEVFKVIKESKSSHDENFFISPWEAWQDTGLMTKINFANDNIHEILKTKIGKSQHDSIIKLEDAFWPVIEDYIAEWKDQEGWPYIKNWTIKRGDSSTELIQTDQNLLMYYPNLNKRLAMMYHTDHHQYDADSKGWKLFITVTVYLNDDYEGGELSFINEKNKEIIYFKPKAGDITVFPSMLPYFHGVEPISSGEKYLSRSFAALYYEGSDDWKKKCEEYGEDNFINMEKERIKSVWNSPEYFRVPTFLDDDLENSLIKEARGKQINFPFSKEEAKNKFLIRWDDEI